MVAELCELSKKKNMFGCRKSSERVGTLDMLCTHKVNIDLEYKKEIPIHRVLCIF